MIAGATPVLVHNWDSAANEALGDIPVPEDSTKFNVRAGELVNNSVETHPLNEFQMEGGETVGHGGVRNLSNNELTMPGGPQGTDPVSGARDWVPVTVAAILGRR